MKNIFCSLFALLITFSTFSQVEKMISDSAYFVMEVDLGKIAKSVPIEEINQLEFVKKTLRTISTDENKIQNLSDLGVNFSSKLIVFNIEKSGFKSMNVIIPIDDQEKVLQLFDQYDQAELRLKGFVKSNKGVISLEKSTLLISLIDYNNYVYRDKTNALYARKGWEKPKNIYAYNDYYYESEAYEPVEETIVYEEPYLEEESVEMPPSEIYEEEEIVEEEIISDEELKQIALKKRYDEVLDSITNAEQLNIENMHLNFVKSPANNLYDNDEEFRKVSKQSSDAKMYINPIMNLDMVNVLRHYPVKEYIYDEVKDMRQFAYINFSPTGIEIDWNIKVSDNFAEIIAEGSSGKIDKDLFKYVPDNAQGLAIYNLNTFGAYEKLKEIYMPKLDASDDGEMVLASAVWSTIDEFIDIEAVTSVYPPKVLVSYAGFKEVLLSKTSYEYDSETFEYTEVDTTYLEKIPMFTFALSNERAYLLEKYLKAFNKLGEEKVTKNEHYYTVEQGPFDLGIPFHIAIVDDILIVTNDESVVKDHLNGFDQNAFDKDIYKKARKSTMVYAHMDFSTITQDILDLGLMKNEEKFIRLFGDKTGKVDVELTPIKDNRMSYQINMITNGAYKNGGYFLFELINSVFLFND